MAWRATLIEVQPPQKGRVTLVYEYTDEATTRVFRESVDTLSAQTDAWVQNRGAGRAVELDALDAFALRAASAVGEVVVTDHLKTLPPPTDEQVAANAWVDKVNQVSRINTMVALGVAQKTDLDSLAILQADIQASFLPSYQQYLR